MPKTTKKEELLKRLRQLEDDNLDLSNAFIALEEEFQALRKMIAESYNPYSSNPLLRKALKTPDAQPSFKDESIHINIKR